MPRYGTVIGYTPAPVAAGVDLATGESNFDRVYGWDTTGAAVNSQQMLLQYFTSRKSETTNNVSIWTGATAAAATPSLIRIGFYSVAADYAITLIGSTPNDTTLFAATNTKYTKALSVATARSAGARYAIGILIVTAGALPIHMGKASYGNAITDTWLGTQPRVTGTYAGQADLPSGPVADASLANTRRNFYFELT